MDTFETIAEIAIALTGFTGIVTVLRDRPGGAWGAAEVFYLKALLWWSLGTMFMSFVPSALALLADGGPVPWRVAHGIFAVFHIIVFLWFFWATRDTRGQLRPRSWLIIAAGFSVLALELSVVLGYFPGHGQLFYLVALLWFLYLAAGTFAALLLPSDDPSESPF